MKLAKLSVVCMIVAGSSIAFAQSDSGRTVYKADEPSSASGKKVYEPSSESPPSNVYVGVNLGQNKTNLTAALSTTSDTSYSLLAGYRFNRNLAIEGAYLNLGKISLPGSVSADLRGLSVAALGSFAMGHTVSAYGKFGIARTDANWSVAPAAGTNSLQSKTGLTYGVGLMFDIAARSEIRLSYDRYQIGTDDPVTGGSDVVSLGFVQRF